MSWTVRRSGIARNPRPTTRSSRRRPTGWRTPRSGRPNLFSSLELSYVSTEISQPTQGGFEAQAILDQYGVWRNSFSFHSARQPQYQAGLTTSGFFDTGDLRHEIKVGLGYKKFTNDSADSWPGGGIVGYEPPVGFAAVTRSGILKWKSNSYDAYVGDTILAGNLTVNVGARFDYQQSKNLPSTVPANPLYPGLLPAVRYGGDSGYPITWRQVEPRLGATYSLGHDRKTLLRASYSRFTNRLGEEITIVSAFPGTQGLYYAWDDPNGNHHVDPDEIDTSNAPLFSNGVDPANPGAVVAFNEIARDFKPATTAEVIIGAEREIVSGLSAALAYTHRSVRNTEWTLNYFYYPLVGTTRDSYQYVGNASGKAVGSDGFVLDFNEPSYALTQCSSDPCSSFLIQNRADYTETYNGLELQLIKRLSHGWMLRRELRLQRLATASRPRRHHQPEQPRGGHGRERRGRRRGE